MKNQNQQENFTSSNSSFDLDQVDQALKKVTNWNQLVEEGGPLQQIFKSTIERLLKSELDGHLGYKTKEFSKSRLVDNKRNGSYKKTLKTCSGNIEIDVPRDRNGSFEPKVVPKHDSLNSKLERQIISMYAKGLSTRDISDHLKEVYLGIEISPTQILHITDSVLDGIKEWQSRNLEEVYPIVFLDGIFFKVKEGGAIENKAAHILMGINLDGKKDILGVYLSETESASFWLATLADIKNRGVKDILIACIDGLKGFPEAIQSIYPKTEIQTCIVHQIRNSLRYICSNDKKEFLKDLKNIYKAPSENVAKDNLESLTEKWSNKYGVVTNSWNNNWGELSNYFKYPGEIRKIIYTTNIIEGYNRQLRKATKTKTMFPSDQSLQKMMFLVYLDISRKWTMPVQNWPMIISQLSIYFKNRIKLKL
jgi:putative transposase